MNPVESKVATYVSLPLSAAMLAAAVMISFGPRMGGDDDAYQQIDLITKTLGLIDEQYVEELDSWEVVYDGLTSMARRDPYSTFYSPRRAGRFNEETHREYFGVGFSVNPDQPPLTIDYLFEGSPAEQKGLMPGDRIIAVDGRAIESFTDDDPATQAIKGPEHTKVTLTVKKADTGEEVKVTLPRARIIQRTVFSEHYQDPDGKIAYLRIDAFGESTATEPTKDTPNELDDHLRRIRDSGAEGLILDLRFNQGGLVPQCRTTANRFLNEGDLVGIEHRNKEENEAYPALPDECWLPDLPMVVLVNGDTASAAEIVAGALQDHKRALLVGERTYGKGVVQSIYEIAIDNDNDDKAILKITTAEYVTPAGRKIEKAVKRASPVRGGLEPDYTIKLDEATSRELQIRFALMSIPAKYRDHYLEVRESELPDPDDRQLQAALKVLRGETVAQDL